MSEPLTDAQLERLLKTTLGNIEKLSVAASDNELALAHLFRVAAYAHYSVHQRSTFTITRPFEVATSQASVPSPLDM